MKQLIAFFIYTCLAVPLLAQTISYKDQTKNTTTNIQDATIKGKTATITERPEILTLVVNKPKQFTAKATDADKKDIPLDPSPGNIKTGTAILSFIPNSTVASANISAGLATGDAQTLQANINVTSHGYYTAYTDALNGIQFFSTGYLEKEGPQVITLKASGTPLATGTFNFTITAAGITTPASVVVTGGTAVTAAATTINRTGVNCTEYKLEGTLIQNKALTADNKITIKIDATTIGFYNLSSKPINGYFYSSSGKITATGTQEIVLTGKGTPLSAGTNKVSTSDAAGGCEADVTVGKMEPDFFEYNISNEVTNVEFTDPDNGDKYSLTIAALKTDDNNADEDPDAVLGGASAYENAIYKKYGEENLILTPYGLMINSKTLDNTRYIYGGSNYVHIFLDEMGNSLITGIPQGMPEIQYVVHVLYKEESNGKKVSYGIKTTNASFTGISRIENNRSSNANAELSGKPVEPKLREYTLVIRTADADIDFEIYRFENGKQLGSRLSYTVPMTNSYTANISLGLLNTWLKNPAYSFVTDPLNPALNVAKQEEGNNRGIVAVFATLYTSPITVLKYYLNRKQMEKGKKLSKVKNPVTNAQLHSKNYLYMRPVWERIYPSIGVAISDKVFQNLFFGLNWEFARGGSFFAGGHFGKVNVFNQPAMFEFEKTNLTQDQFNLYSNKDWRVGWAIGASIDFAIIGNLFK